MEPTKLATLIYPIDKGANAVILATQTRGPGVGYRFGYGGKIEDGEDADTCVCRETQDESGGAKDKTRGIIIDKNDLERVALIDFYKGENRPFGNPTFRVLCYRTFRWTGVAEKTDEMDDPKPFPIDTLFSGETKHEMKPGDELFVPQILAGTPVKGWVRFSEDSKTVLGHEILPCSLEDLVI